MIELSRRKKKERERKEKVLDRRAFLRRSAKRKLEEEKQERREISRERRLELNKQKLQGRLGAFTESKPGDPLVSKSSLLPGRNQPCICGSGKKYKKCCWSDIESNKIKIVMKEDPTLQQPSQ